MPRRSRAVLVAAALTYIGASCLLVIGPIFLLGARGGSVLGRPSKDVVLAGTAFPVHAAPVVGAILTVVGLALVVLAVLAQRGYHAGRLGLTVIGGLALVGLVYSAVTGDLLSALVPLAWITVALALLWVGERRSARRSEPGRAGTALLDIARRPARQHAGQLTGKRGDR